MCIWPGHVSHAKYQIVCHNSIVMVPHTRTVECISPLLPLDARGLSPHVRVYQAIYLRQIPAHYLGNPHTREQVTINVVLAEGGRLVVPRSARVSFVEFYRELGLENEALLRRVISPSGTAKSAATNNITPIKEITETIVGDFRLPGDAQLYGWPVMQAQAARQQMTLELFFQGNGLYYNRGSVLYDGILMLAYPDLFLADALDDRLSPREREQLAISESCLQRPILFFVVAADNSMRPHLHRFLPGESYRQGIDRLEEEFASQQVHCAMAASPPLIIPTAENAPRYLTLEEILGEYHANDVRHALYCPYEGAVLLSAELGRAQCLQPAQLAASIADAGGPPVRIPLAETLNRHESGELSTILERKGYGGRFFFAEVEGRPSLAIHPLEAVYSFLVPFLTRGGVFGLIQTSGTRGNITGNDGPTLRQLSAILRDLNNQPPFANDPIIAAASGSQGNDVPNILSRARDGAPGLLASLLPEASLDENPIARGIVTTPRVGIGFPFYT
jgi:hypothetical protein